MKTVYIKEKRKRKWTAWDDLATFLYVLVGFFLAALLMAGAVK